MEARGETRDGLLVTAIIDSAATLVFYRHSETLPSTSGRSGDNGIV